MKSLALLGIVLYKLWDLVSAKNQNNIIQDNSLGVIYYVTCPRVLFSQFQRSCDALVILIPGNLK